MCFLQLHNAGIYSLDALIYTTFLLYRYHPELGDESADREDRSNDERDTHTLCHGSIQCQHYSRDKTATVENKVKARNQARAYYGIDDSSPNSKLPYGRQLLGAMA